jgi:hypothetical protein
MLALNVLRRHCSWLVAHQWDLAPCIWLVLDLLAPMPCRVAFEKGYVRALDHPLPISIAALKVFRNVDLFELPGHTALPSSYPQLIEERKRKSRPQSREIREFAISHVEGLKLSPSA